MLLKSNQTLLQKEAVIKYHATRVYMYKCTTIIICYLSIPRRYIDGNLAVNLNKNLTANQLAWKYPDNDGSYWADWR